MSIFFYYKSLPLGTGIHELDYLAFASAEKFYTTADESYIKVC